MPYQPQFPLDSTASLTKTIKTMPLKTSVAIGIGLGAGVGGLYAINKSYRAWLRLGRGGIPHNFLGWLVNVSLHLVARKDIRDPAAHDSAGNKSSSPPQEKPTLELSSPRAGPRPEVPRTVVPQRQTTETAGPAMLERMRAFVAAVAAANPELVELRPSGLEGPYEQALWLRAREEVVAKGAPPSSAFMRTARGGEFTHPHGEGSTHVVLGSADAAWLIELGWAERHQLSGVLGILPWGYVFVYAPRDEAEFDVWKRVVVASARFVAPDGAKVQVPK